MEYISDSITIIEFLESSNIFTIEWLSKKLINLIEQFISLSKNKNILPEFIQKYEKVKQNTKKYINMKTN